MTMAKTDKDIAKPILKAAVDVAKSVGARIIFAYYDALRDPAELGKAIKSPTELLLVCRDDPSVERAKKIGAKAMHVPSISLTRMGQIKMATLIALSQGLLKGGDTFVFLAGVEDQPIDTLVSMRVGEEYELFQSVGQPKLTEHIRRAVFEKVLTLCLELSHEGREGKPVGTIFVVGDYKEVQKYCQEGRINPFRGYAEKQRNILDDNIRDIVKEIAKLDGAFVVKGNGVIVSACTILQPAASGDKSVQGLGARHAAAAGITSNTRAVAVSLSESTGAVRVWRLGTMITEIERSARQQPEAPPSSGTAV
jgi:diadenylate cyclase